MSRNGRTLLGAIAALAVLAADQASKWWVLHVLDLPRLGDVRLLPVLDFTMVWNRGVTFGLFNGLGVWGGPALALLALVIVAVLAVWLRRTDSALAATAIGAIAGGAIGNVIDRLRYGAVVDFIRAHVGGWSWYVFNVADAAIVCGVIVLAVMSQFPARAQRNGSGPVGRSAGDACTD